MVETQHQSRPHLLRDPPGGAVHTHLLRGRLSRPPAPVVQIGSRVDEEHEVAGGEGDDVPHKVEDAGLLFRVERGRRDKDQDVLDALLSVDHVADHDHAHQQCKEEDGDPGDVQLELRVPVQADEGIKHAENQYRDDGGGHLYSEGGGEAGGNHKRHSRRGNGRREHHDGLKEDEEDGDAIVAPGDLQGLGDKEGEVGHG